jgi:hypothetical protein
MDGEFGAPSVDRDLPADVDARQGALQQQVPASIEAEVSKVYYRDRAHRVRRSSPLPSLNDARAERPF